MARTGALKHTHQYFLTNRGVWRCILDGCTHFVPKNMEPSPLGSKSVCWGCQKEFILTYASMEDTHPRCADCTVIRKIADELVESMPESTNDPLIAALQRRRAQNGAESSNESFLERLKRQRAARETTELKATEPDEIEVIEPDEKK